jgi:hypothetical protein
VQNCETAAISFDMSVRPYVHMEQLGTHWRFLVKFGIWKFFGKSVDKIQVLLKSDKNNGIFNPYRANVENMVSS